ncbi:hypothetical protein C7M84_020539 [Penaeus vannamei]|uniref:Uncharacterized protein n=1 Tax=Penaeus vannamei TaxID=6689 RepID=A0A3R7PWF9_PENVA|nr:hypothetical protein C7M84_020539 [Penaeus vannamei]
MAPSHLLPRQAVHIGEVQGTLQVLERTVDPRMDSSRRALCVSQGLWLEMVGDANLPYYPVWKSLQVVQNTLLHLKTGECSRRSLYSLSPELGTGLALHTTATPGLLSDARVMGRGAPAVSVPPVPESSAASNSSRWHASSRAGGLLLGMSEVIVESETVCTTSSGSRKEAYPSTVPRRTFRGFGWVTLSFRWMVKARSTSATAGVGWPETPCNALELACKCTPGRRVTASLFTIVTSDPVAKKQENGLPSASRTILGHPVNPVLGWLFSSRCASTAARKQGDSTRAVLAKGTHSSPSHHSCSTDLFLPGSRWCDGPPSDGSHTRVAADFLSCEETICRVMLQQGFELAVNLCQEQRMQVSHQPAPLVVERPRRTPGQVWLHRDTAPTLTPLHSEGYPLTALCGDSTERHGRGLPSTQIGRSLSVG